MTEEKLNDLQQRAQPFLGQSIQVKFRNNPEIKTYTFRDISFHGFAEPNEPMNYSAYAKLVAADGDMITEPLEAIIRHFEKHSK